MCDVDYTSFSGAEMLKSAHVTLQKEFTAARRAILATPGFEPPAFNARDLEVVAIPSCNVALFVFSACRDRDFVLQRKPRSHHYICSGQSNFNLYCGVIMRNLYWQAMNVFLFNVRNVCIVLDEMPSLLLHARLREIEARRASLRGRLRRLLRGHYFDFDSTRTSSDSRGVVKVGLKSERNEEDEDDEINELFEELEAGYGTGVGAVTDEITDEGMVAPAATTVIAPVHGAQTLDSNPIPLVVPASKQDSNVAVYSASFLSRSVSFFSSLWRREDAK